VAHQVVKVGNSCDLANVVKIGVVEPSQVLTLKLEGESVVLINGSVLHLVHLVKLALEEDELFAGLRLAVNHASLVLLEGVDDFHEVALAHEESVVLGITLLCKVKSHTRLGELK